MWGFSTPEDTSQEYMCFLNHRLNNDIRGHRDTHDQNKGEEMTQLLAHADPLLWKNKKNNKKT